MRYSELNDSVRDVFFYRLDSAELLGPWARQMRELTDVTSTDVASVMGTSKETVCSLERGSYMPKLGTAIRLAGAHKCDLWVVRRGIEFA